MRWHRSHQADPRACALADRHYSRKTVGAPLMMPPGRMVVLLTGDGDAIWGTSWPLAEYGLTPWAGAWTCTIFRNESPHLSSELIREAVAATRWFWPAVPDLGMVTFVDPRKVRRKRDPGRCFRKAGFVPCGTTKSGHHVLQLVPDAMPDACAPIGVTRRMLEAA